MPVLQRRRAARGSVTRDAGTAESGPLAGRRRGEGCLEEACRPPRAEPRARGCDVGYNPRPSGTRRGQGQAWGTTCSLSHSPLRLPRTPTPRHDHGEGQAAGQWLPSAFHSTGTMDTDAAVSVRTPCLFVRGRQCRVTSGPERCWPWTRCRAWALSCRRPLAAPRP